MCANKVSIINATKVDGEMYLKEADVLALVRRLYLITCEPSLLILTKSLEEAKIEDGNSN